MKTIMAKTLAVASLCTVLASVSTGAFAQDAPGYHRHHAVKHARHHIKRLQAAYAHKIAIGDSEGAARMHQKAKAIRHHIREVRHH